MDFASAPVLATASPTSVLSPLEAPTVVSVAPKMVVLIDPLSTGVMLQERLVQAGYHIILVWSDRTQAAAREKHYIKTGMTPKEFAAVIVHEPNELKQTLAGIQTAVTDEDQIVAVVCGSEFGVVLEDEIAKGLNVLFDTTRFRSSGLEDPQIKVDKNAQANILRNAGLNAVREVLARSEQDVKDFLKQQDKTQPFRAVAKPQTGQGSVGVSFCNSEEDLWNSYHAILAGEHKTHCSNRYKHYDHAGVLLQEYLAGTEFIVNMVVLDGVAKTTAIWKYDKRPYNSGDFVCFSKELMEIDDEPQVLEVQVYAEQVIQALGFTNGAVHAEIMHTSRGPVLVEINCRLHGGNGAWVHPAEMCYGYSQLNVFMDAYLNQGQNDFAAIPSRPGKAHRRCQQVKMRTHKEGTLDSYIESQMERIFALPSYFEHFFSVKPGDALQKTIDMPTVPGEITLVHQDKEQLDKDYRELNEILREGIFQVVEESPSL